jgi:hypothetical protein
MVDMRSTPGWAHSSTESASSANTVIFLPRGQAQPSQQPSRTGIVTPLEIRGAGNTGTPEAGKVIRLLDWVTRQFRELACPALTTSRSPSSAPIRACPCLASVLRGAEIMTREGTRLTHWLDALRASTNPGPSVL